MRMLYVLLLLVLVVAGILTSVAMGVDEQDVQTLVAELDYAQLAESVRQNLADTPEPQGWDALEAPLWLLAYVDLESLLREYSPEVAQSVYEYLFTGAPLELELETSALRTELSALFADNEQFLQILEQVSPDTVFWLRKLPGRFRNWALSELAELALAQLQALPATLDLWVLVATEDPQTLTGLARVRRGVVFFPVGLGLVYGSCACLGWAIFRKQPRFWGPGILLLTAGLVLLTLGYNGKDFFRYMPLGEYRWLAGVLGAWFHRGARLPGLSYLGLGLVVVVFGWVSKRCCN